MHDVTNVTLSHAILCDWEGVVNPIPILRYKGLGPKAPNDFKVKRIISARIKKEDLASVYTLPFLTTKNTQLRMFQVKIIHNILPTKASLFKQKLKENENCYFCKEKQDLAHLFIASK